MFGVSLLSYIHFYSFIIHKLSCLVKSILICAHYGPHHVLLNVCSRRGRIAVLSTASW